MDFIHLLEDSAVELSDIPPDSPDYAATFRSIAEGNPFHTDSLGKITGFLSTSKPLPPTPNELECSQPSVSVPGSFIPKAAVYTYSVSIKPINSKAAQILGIDTLYYLILDGTRMYILDSSSIYRLLITFHLELPVQVKQSSDVNKCNQVGLTAYHV
jgi:hypothetical protein